MRKLRSTLGFSLKNRKQKESTTLEKKESGTATEELEAPDVVAEKKQSGSLFYKSVNLKSKIASLDTSKLNAALKSTFSSKQRSILKNTFFNSKVHAVQSIDGDDGSIIESIIEDEKSGLGDSTLVTKTNTESAPKRKPSMLASVTAKLRRPSGLASAVTSKLRKPSMLASAATGNLRKSSILNSVTSKLRRPSGIVSSVTATVRKSSVLSSVTSKLRRVSSIAAPEALKQWMSKPRNRVSSSILSKMTKKGKWGSGIRKRISVLNPFKASETLDGLRPSTTGGRRRSSILSLVNKITTTKKAGFLKKFKKTKKQKSFKRSEQATADERGKMLAEDAELHVFYRKEKLEFELNSMRNEEEKMRSILRSRKVLAEFFQPEHWQRLGPIFQFLEFTAPAAAATTSPMFEAFAEYHTHFILQAPRPHAFLRNYMWNQRPIMQHILSYISPNKEDVRAYARVSTKCQKQTHALPLRFTSCTTLQRFLQQNQNNESRSEFIESCSLTGELPIDLVLQFTNMLQLGLPDRTFPHLKQIYLNSLFSNPITEEDVTKLCKTLSISNLQVLQLKSLFFLPRHLKCLSQTWNGVKTNVLFAQLREFDISDNPLGYEGLYHLKQAIKGPSMPHLETLNLSGTNVGDEGMSIVCEMLPLLLHLKVIHLGHNRIGINGIHRMIPSLSLFATLEAFHFEGNTTEVQASHDLLSYMSAHVWKRLQVFNLSGNKLGSLGGIVLAKNLQTGVFPVLTTLLLDECGLGLDGFLPIAEALGNSNLSIYEMFAIGKVLTTISIRGNAIGPQGAHALGQVLQHCTALTHLDLTRNELSSDGFYHLSRALQGMKKVPFFRTLRLGDNEAGTEGLKTFLPTLLLPNMQFLRLVDFHANHINAMGIHYLSKTISKCFHLVQLHEIDVSFNEEYRSQEIYLFEAIHGSACPSLSCIRLGSGAISHEEGLLFVHKIQKMIHPTAMQHQRDSQTRIRQFTDGLAEDKQRAIDSTNFANEQAILVANLDAQIRDHLVGKRPRGEPLSSKHKVFAQQARKRRIDLLSLQSRQSFQRGNNVEFPHESVLDQKARHAVERLELGHLHHLERTNMK